MILLVGVPSGQPVLPGFRRWSSPEAIPEPTSDPHAGRSSVRENPVFMRVFENPTLVTMRLEGRQSQPKNTGFPQIS
jgi:hypothetical protein